MTPLAKHFHDHWAEYLFGIVFIVIYAHNRFNTPPTQKFKTTKRQYYAAYAFYVMVLIGSYLIISYTPALFNQLEKFRQGLPEAVQRLSPPLLFALLLTVLLPQVRTLRELDESLRKFFWTKASIPDAALAVKREMKNANFTVPAEVRQAVQQRLEDVDDRLDLNRNDYELTPWVKVCALSHQLQDWHGQRKYGAYARTISGELQRLNADCDHYYEEVKEYVKETAGTTRPVLDRTFKNLQRQADVILSDLYMLIAQGVIYHDPGDKARTDALRSMGFTNVESTTIVQPPEVFVLVFIVVLGIFLVCFTLFASDPNRPFPNRMFDSARIALMYCLSVACATLIPKSFKSEETDQYSRQVRLRNWAWAGLAAVAICGVVNVLCYRMEYKSWGAVWFRFGHSFPYLFFCFLTAFGTAFLIDRKARRLAPAVDGLSLGIASVLVALLVHSMLDKTYQSQKQQMESSRAQSSETQPSEVAAYKDWAHKLEPRKPPRREILLVFSGITGFFIGLVVPYWYRKAKAQLPNAATEGIVSVAEKPAVIPASAITPSPTVQLTPPQAASSLEGLKQQAADPTAHTGDL